MGGRIFLRKPRGYKHFAANAAEELLVLMVVV
jgi:hypothetical protein